MKKIILYFSLFILICFILPALLTKNKTNCKETATNEYNSNNEIKEELENNKTEEFKYNKYSTIKLLHSKTGDIEEIPLDEYLYGVVSAEMPADFEKEALKAQAIVARTYTIYKIQNKKHEDADICDNSACCQAWISKEDRLNKWDENVRESNWEKIKECVEETKGKIIVYENLPINAFFHSNSGGKTEMPINVWGGSGLPYLQVVETAGEDNYKQYNSEVELTNTELLDKIKEKHKDISIDFSNSDDIKILEYTESGRVKTVKFGNYNLSGVEARTILGLKSTNFEIIKENNNIKFSVKGYGHGVGMSQTGADAMAKQGSTAEDIITHFYTGVEIKSVNDI